MPLSPPMLYINLLQMVSTYTRWSQHCAFPDNSRYALGRQYQGCKRPTINGPMEQEMIYIPHYYLNDFCVEQNSWNFKHWSVFQIGAMFWPYSADISGWVFLALDGHNRKLPLSFCLLNIRWRPVRCPGVIWGLP